MTINRFEWYRGLSFALDVLDVLKTGQLQLGSIMIGKSELDDPMLCQGQVVARANQLNC
jgi:hypothetical protein